MKFSIQTDVLKNMTGTLTKIVSRDIPGSSFGCIEINVSKNTLSLKTQQLDFNIVYSSKIKESEEGSVFVPIQVLDGVINPLIDTLVTVGLVGKKLIISTNTSTSEIFILENIDSVVSVEKPNQKPSFLIRREIFVQGIRNVYHAAAESVIKPEIASIYLYTKDNTVYFVSTDAFRLAEMRFLSDQKEMENDVSVLIPIKSVVKILRVLENLSDTVIDLYIHDSSIFIVTSNTIIKTNSVKGNFPDYKSIIPSNFSVEITLLKTDVLNFLKKAKLFANNLNKLSFSILNEKEITLSFDNEIVGLTKNTIPASIKGTIEHLPSFNYRFISDALSVIQDERIIFSVVDDETKPLMIRGVDDSTLTTVVSPLLDK